MVAVIPPDVPGQQQLPFTLEELRRIEKRVPNLVKLGTSESPASVTNVLHHLSDASIVHFACHGIQHPTNPMKSALLLPGERMTVSTLMKHPMPYASLVFLSACETAKGDETVPDEALHLAATMLFTGFRGVVGTMWFVFKSGPRQSRSLTVA
jgi:CHAT domain-containing protein